MEKNRLIIVLLVMSSIMGLSLLGVGLTGMVTLNDETTRPTCVGNSDCTAPDICCLFFEEEAGVCHQADMCARISEITKYEKEQKLAAGYLAKVESKTLKENYYSQLLIGLVILVMVLIYARLSLKQPKKVHS